MLSTADLSQNAVIAGMLREYAELLRQQAAEGFRSAAYEHGGDVFAAAGREGLIALPAIRALDRWALTCSFIGGFGYRVSSGAGVFFYLPDVADLPSPASALRGVDVYVGDGATLTRPIVRIRDGVRIGHGLVAVQLGWCSKAGVRKAIFTHWGSPIVRADARTLNAIIGKLGREPSVDASIACDREQLFSSRAGRHERLSDGGPH